MNRNPKSQIPNLKDNPKSPFPTLKIDRSWGFRFGISGLGFRIVLGMLLGTLFGCTRPQARGQREEENERDRYPVKLVGDVASFSNADPIPVHGVGLVEDLDGTGGPAPAGGLRDTLEHDLIQQRAPDVK